MIAEPLSPASVLSAPLSTARTVRWRPGLPGAERDVAHAEVLACGCEAAGAALALALAADHLRAAGDDGASSVIDQRAWLWVQDARAQRLGGRPFLHGLPQPLRHRLIHVAARTSEDALFALEEGLRCRDLAFVLGEIAGNPRALDFTASRRLGLAVQRHGVPLWLVRLDAARDLSAARMRWQAVSAPSPAGRGLARWNARSPGPPAWRAELFRARRHPPATWILCDDGPVLASETPDTRDLAQAAGYRSLAPGSISA